MASAPGSTAWAHTTSVSSAFNANDQLTSSSASVDGGTAQVQSYGYDQNGAEKTVASASGTSTNGWNFEGKLTATALADASGAANGGSANSFDAQGDRLARTSDVGKASQKTTSYFVDTDTSYSQVVEERAPDVSDAAGQPALQARYVWGQGLAPLAMWRKTASGVKLFFYQTDGQESVRQLTSAAGEVTDSYFYDAWGNALAGGSGVTENPFRYTGQQRDPDGRYYLRARFYNPGNGRFLSHDPLMGSGSDPVSLHRYLYAGADGINVCDPTGQFGLADAMMAIGVSSTLAAPLAAATTTAFGYAGAVTGVLGAYNIYASYAAGADINGWDVFDVATASLPLLGRVSSFLRLGGVSAKGLSAISGYVEARNVMRGVFSGASADYELIGKVVVVDGAKAQQGIKALMAEIEETAAYTEGADGIVENGVKSVIKYMGVTRPEVWGHFDGIGDGAVQLSMWMAKGHPEETATLMEELVHLRDYLNAVNEGKLAFGDYIHMWQGYVQTEVNAAKEMASMGVSKRILVNGVQYGGIEGHY